MGGLAICSWARDLRCRFARSGRGRRLLATTTAAEFFKPIPNATVRRRWSVISARNQIDFGCAQILCHVHPSLSAVLNTAGFHQAPARGTRMEPTVAKLSLQLAQRGYWEEFVMADSKAERSSTGRKGLARMANAVSPNSSRTRDVACPDKTIVSMPL